ncbi:hypothetical protein, partial [Paenibacillus chitinolyticus]
LPAGRMHSYQSIAAAYNGMSAELVAQRGFSAPKQYTARYIPAAQSELNAPAAQAAPAQYAAPAAAPQYQAPPPAVPAGVNAVTGEIGPGYAAPQQGNEPPF